MNSREKKKRERERERGVVKAEKGHFIAATLGRADKGIQ
jgi:hypothetical protein